MFSPGAHKTGPKYIDKVLPQLLENYSENAIFILTRKTIKSESLSDDTSKKLRALKKAGITEIAFYLHDPSCAIALDKTIDYIQGLRHTCEKFGIKITALAIDTRNIPTHYTRQFLTADIRQLIFCLPPELHDIHMPVLKSHLIEKVSQPDFTLTFVPKEPVSECACAHSKTPCSPCSKRKKGLANWNDLIDFAHHGRSLSMVDECKEQEPQAESSSMISEMKEETFMPDENASTISETKDETFMPDESPSMISDEDLFGESFAPVTHQFYYHNHFPRLRIAPTPYLEGGSHAPLTPRTPVTIMLDEMDSLDDREEWTSFLNL